MGYMSECECKSEGERDRLRHCFHEELWQEQLQRNQFSRFSLPHSLTTSRPSLFPLDVPRDAPNADLMDDSCRVTTTIAMIFRTHSAAAARVATVDRRTKRLHNSYKLSHTNDTHTFCCPCFADAKHSLACLACPLAPNDSAAVAAES